MEGSENNAKISDSAYSNSCSNSQSRRSSKSTHSGSNSSGSSGYGGKPDYGSDAFNQPPEKRLKEKDGKKKKQLPLGTIPSIKITKIEEETDTPEPAPVPESIKEDTSEVKPTTSPEKTSVEPEKEKVKTTSAPETEDTKEDGKTPQKPETTHIIITSNNPSKTNGFSCVISITDGIVMYTTSTITSSLFYPKDMWVGRSFIDFVHPKDRNVFATQITKSLAEQKKLCVTTQENPTNAMVCRLRHYRALSTGFGVKNRPVTFTPFMLKVSFKTWTKDNVEITYLVIQALPLFTAYKTPNEVITKPTPFTVRHSATGIIESVDPASVTYLGYLPQDLTNQDILSLYHPNDLAYMNEVYQSIVKDGGKLRTKPYRMLAHNGNYVKVETEWTSFINPWLKRVEFVIGKHFIVEGPTIPDVFLTSDPAQELQLSEDEVLKAKSLKESIVKILHDERDSVMLGGISPHHGNNDSKSSTETPVSYNQLNYNETLQRYFESHPPYTINEENSPAIEENTTESKDPNTDTNERMSSEAQTGDSGDGENNQKKQAEAKMTAEENQAVRLTESLLSKHNAVMEKQLVKIHREIRSNTKGNREKYKQKKKEHLDRCNQPTSVGINVAEAHMIKAKPHGVKRNNKQMDTEQRAHKHHCGSPTHSKRHQTTSTTTAQAAPTATATTSATPWEANQVNNMNAFYIGMGIPQQMSIVSPVTAVPGTFPVQYVSASSQPIAPSVTDSNAMARNIAIQYPTPAMQCMMYGLAVYGTPVVYSAMNPQVSYPVQYVNNVNQAGLASNNNAEKPTNAKDNARKNEKKRSGSGSRPEIRVETQPVAKPEPATKPVHEARAELKVGCSVESRVESGVESRVESRVESLVESRVQSWVESRVESRNESQVVVSKADQGNSLSNSSTDASNRSTEAARDKAQNNKDVQLRLGNSEETEGSSFSSFYSSFFKTESGSAEESSDPKKQSPKEVPKITVEPSVIKPEVVPVVSEAQGKKIARRKMEPPWIQQVSVSSELIYKYQVLTKSMEEVLSCDKQKIKSLEQPSLVNEQLGQLYLDLQLEGVAARLTLEEGITSSSSSGEDLIRIVKVRRKKREFSKLVMIYEENAPLPPPETSPP